MSPNDWVGLIGGVLGILVIVVGGLMWYVRVVVRDEVGKATKPIQPGYRNGGQSLADIADTVSRIADKIGLEK
jgi:uncharacterized iron-regulated membrane protein